MVRLTIILHSFILVNVLFALYLTSRSYEYQCEKLNYKAFGDLHKRSTDASACPDTRIHLYPSMH